MSGCKDNNPVVPPTQNDNTFAIYFLKDTTLTIKDILSTNLEDLVLADKPWISQEDIDFYDWSSHCIYLKKDKSYFFRSDFDSFTPDFLYKLSWVDRPLIVVANGKKCYTSYFFSTLLSDFWPSPDIFDFDITHYPKDVIYTEWPYPFAKDVRSNQDVKKTLNNLDILHEGLQITMDSILIDNAETTTIRYKITINNNDSDNLYVLDPDKIETSLFYAFTNGPEFYNSTNNTVYRSLNTGAIVPTYGTFKPEWFSKIKSGQSINRMITLKGYPHLPDGNYYCSFSFNNPYYIKKEERMLSDGRYWMGPTRSELIGFNWIDSGGTSLKVFTSTKIQKLDFF